VAVVGTTPVWFDKVGSDYTARYGADTQFKLRHDVANEKFEVTSQGGSSVTRWKFHDFAQAGSPKGAMVERMDPSGLKTTVEAYQNGTNKIKEMKREVVADGKTTVHRLDYEYNANDHITSALIRKQVDAGEWTHLRRSEYEYYGSSESGGNEGDLKRMTMQEPGTSGGSSSSSSSSSPDDWSCVGQTYCRYYKDGQAKGFEHGLKYTWV